MGHNFYEIMVLVFTVLKQCAKCHQLEGPSTYPAIQDSGENWWEEN